MKNASFIFAIGAAAAMCSTAALGARIDSTYSTTGFKSADASNVVAPGSARVGIVYDFDVAGIESVDGFGSPDNTVIALDLAAALGYASGTPLVMNGIGWNVTMTGGLDSAGLSWLSEMRVYFDDNISPDGTGLFLAPSGTNGPGTETNSSDGMIKLADAGIPDIALPDGVLRMEFFESFDDEAGIDGLWKSGVLNIQVVPAPGAAMVLGLGGLAMARRRR